jgi:hypothetical protein
VKVLNERGQMLLDSNFQVQIAARSGLPRPFHNSLVIFDPG